MEKIQKYISIEPFKSRFNHKCASYDKDGIINYFNNEKNNWSMIPLDRVIKSNEKIYDIKENLGLKIGLKESSSINNVNKINNVLSYGNMVYWKTWLKKYATNSSFYQLCKRGVFYKWVSLDCDFFKVDYGINIKGCLPLYSYIPNDNDIETYGITVGSIIEVNDEASFFESIFRKENDFRYEIELLNVINNFFNGDKAELSIPIIEIPVYIKQKYDSLGMYQTYSKTWEAHKKYRYGDIVLYNNETYRLCGGDSYELVEVDGGLYDVFLKYYNLGKNNYYKFIDDIDNINNDLVENPNFFENKTLKKIIYVSNENNVKHFYIPCVTHKAIYDRNSDEYTFNTNYWCLYRENLDEEELTSSSGIFLSELIEYYGNDLYVNLKSESRLSSLRRYKKTIDDDGTILPFIISDDGSTDTELVFKMGVVTLNVNSNDVIHGDVMSQIVLNTNNNLESIIFQYNDTLKQVDIIKKITLSPSINAPSTLTLITDYEKKCVLNFKEDKNVYTWFLKKSKKNEFSEGEYIEKLPEANEENLNKIYNTINENGNHEQWECIVGSKSVIYEGFCDVETPIRPSYMLFNKTPFKEIEGVIAFSYIKDAIIENNYVISKTGVLYNEVYPYEISIYGVNYVSSPEVEKIHKHNYYRYDYEPKDGDIVYDTDKNTILTYSDVGYIFCDNVTNKCKRVVSEYTCIDIDFESMQLNDVENYEKNVILSNIQYTGEQIGIDNFPKDFILKTNDLIGVENINEEINVNVERGLSSAFESLHILSEVKTMNDLINYKNNFFKL